MKITSIVNRLGYQMPSVELNKILFGKEPEEITRLQVEQIKSHLAQFNMELPKDQEPHSLEIPDIDQILEGLTPRQFLDQVVMKPYAVVKEKVSDFLSLEKDPPRGIPLRVIRQNLNPGWTRFSYDESVGVCDSPVEELLVCDVETYVRFRGYPVMAAALSSEALYVWLHPSLLNDQPFTPMLIPMGKNKIIINHNIGFDAQTWEESYSLLERHHTLLDTMSMHIATNGMGNQQRMIFEQPFGAKWKSQTSPNNLVDVYNFHVRPLVPLTKDDKSIRNIFVVGDLAQFKANLLDLILYNVRDTILTYELAQYLWPKYLHHNPETFTLAGHILLNSSVLPVVPEWDRWVFETNQTHSKLSRDLNENLSALAYSLEKSNPEDFWTNQLDWTPAKSGANKGKSAWFRKLVLGQISKKGKNPISPKSNLAPLLLKLSWKGQPLYKTKKNGWCYLSDEENPSSFIDPGSGLRLAKIPHPKGDTKNCGNPLSKDYIKYIEDGTLSSPDERAREFMQTAKSLSYWSSMKSRVSEFRPEIARDTNTNTTMLKPCIVPHGTITRRAVEPTWLTCSDIKPGIVGSELKSRVQAPEGFVLVGADFNTQESRIGAAKADTYYGLHGSSAMSLTQILGSKEDHTDGHSLLAKDLGLWPDRQLAKTLNFLMLFFGGQKGLFEAIKTARTDLNDGEATNLAKMALKLRRGKKEGQFYKGGTDSFAYNYMIKLAETEENRTVLGNSAICAPLQKKYCGSEFMPSRCNRSIQSAGVDILHVFVSFLEYLIALYGVKGKYLISIHDENWSLVVEKDAMKMVDIFQICHLFTWTIFFETYGFDTIPFNYLFFSDVNIDKVLRKEPNNVSIKDPEKGWVYQGCKTISNPHCTVPPGQSVSIRKIDLT